MKFYILSLEHTRGEVACWWRPNSSGYTNDLKQAGLYGYEEAKEIVRLRPGQKERREVAIPNERFSMRFRQIVDLSQQDGTREQFIALAIEGFDLYRPEAAQS